MTLSEHISRSELISGKEDKAKELNRKWEVKKGDLWEQQGHHPPFRFPEFNFVDVAIGGVDRRNNVRDVHEVQKLIRQDVPCFTTWQRYPNDFLEYVHANGHSVKGYAGPSYADFVPFDFDSKTNLGLSHKWATDFAKYLEASFEVSLDSLQYFFSGTKGFHILVPIDFFGDIQPSEHFTKIIKMRHYGFQLIV